VKASGFVYRGGSSTARGYGADWQRLRLVILAGEPLCRFCASRRIVTPATEVDHVVPFEGLADPRRLDPANLRPLCRPCHLRRSARQVSGKVAPMGCDADGWPLPIRTLTSNDVARKNMTRGEGGSQSSEAGRYRPRPLLRGQHRKTTSGGQTA
jgi:hypothetical protein